MQIRDVLYGDMGFSDDESKLINSYSFNRLRKIKQLAFGEYIFPGATHNRYSHSLGVATVISQMFDSVDAKNKGYLTKEDRNLLRMMGLVHDMGHSPYSHSSMALSEITHEDRLPDILNFESNNVVLENSFGVDPKDLITQTYLGEGALFYSNDKLILLHEFMDSFIDADKMDYLRRDSYMCGLSYGNFEFHDLIRSLTLIPSKSGVYHLGITPDGLHALESFVLARYYMFSKVYLDPISCLYDKLYLQEVRRYLPNGCMPDDIKKFLTWDDTKLIGKLSFLDDTGFELVYDQDFDETAMQVIDSRLGGYLLKDIVKKAVYRKNENDSQIYVRDDVLGRVTPATELSPLLKRMEFERLHRLRYYAPKPIADELRNKIRVVLEGAFKYAKYGV